MESKNESSMNDAFIYVRDVFRNCVRILLSADPIMEERGFGRIKWDHIFDMEPITNIWRSLQLINLNHADALFPGYLFHQYKIKEVQGIQTILTICTAPWRKFEPEKFHPCCCATIASYTSVPNDIYWIGVIPVWQNNNLTDGKIHNYIDQPGLISEQLHHKFNELVMKDGQLFGISVPLEEITSSDDLKYKVVDPLLTYYLAIGNV
ncbi:MAG: hypothetical protein ACOYNC_15540 [Bacteroidales bacterium]